MTNKDTCDQSHTDYKNNGLITKIWGGPGWIFNHSITFGYPLEPTEEQKAKYKNYFISLGDVLPCRLCRESYKKIINTGDTALTDDVLKNRETLTKWLYRVHEAVNAKLEIDYGITYDEMVDRYESFRAKCGVPELTNKGCVAPLDYKAFSFKKLYYVDAPIVPLEMVKPFIRLAKIRGINNQYLAFIKLAKKLNGEFARLKNLECWQERNKWCQQQIKYMRENAIGSIEEKGIWKGMPTIDELKLLMFLSSNLNRSELIMVLSKLKNNFLYTRRNLLT
jgi:hypothetical protein